MISKSVTEEILKLYDSGVSKNQIAKQLDLSWDTVNRVLKHENDHYEKQKPDHNDDITEQFAQFSQKVVYEAELEGMIDDIEARTDAADDLTWRKIDIITKKIEWALQQIDHCNEGIMTSIRSEFEDLIATPTQQQAEILINGYHYVKQFEREKGMTIETMVQFVNNNSPLLFDSQQLQQEVAALAGEKLQLEKGINKLQTIETAYKRGVREGERKGHADAAIWNYCAICGQPIVIQPQSNEHREIIEWFRQRGLGHPGCHQMQAHTIPNY